MCQQATRLDPQQATRRQRQLDFERVKTQGLECRTGDQQQQEASQGDIQGTPVSLAERRVKAPEPPPDHHRQEDDPPPGGKAEQVEHQVGDPRAEMAGRVEQGSRNDRMRPARVVLAVTPKRQRQEQGDDPQSQPARLVQQVTDLFRQLAGSCAAGGPDTHVQVPVIVM